MDLWEAMHTTRGLIDSLQKSVDKDPEQEVQGSAVRVVDAVIAESRKLIPNHPVIRALPDLISPAAVEDGAPLRAADLLLILIPLHEALSREHDRRKPARVWSPDL